MKGYWHFVAFSTATAILTHIFNSYWLAVVFVLWLCYLFYVKRLRKLPLLVSLATFITVLWWQPVHMLEPGGLAEAEDTTLVGKVTRPLITSEQKIEFTLQDNETHQTFIINYFPDHSDASAQPLKTEQIKHGATCQVTGHLQKTQSSRNPGQFDYQNYLLTQGISSQMIIHSMEDITCEGRSLRHPLYILRTTLQDLTVEKLSPQTSAWLNALVLGDRTLLNEDVISLFQKWGMSHVLAISGLHIGLIVSLIYFVLVKLNMTTKEKAQLVLIFFLPLYAMIAGGQPSVWRASLMILLFLNIRKFNMHYSTTDILSIVFMILAIYDPNIVFHIGFQMSFIVTFSLLLSKTWLDQTSSRFYQMLKISFVAQMVILPIQFMNFYTFQPLSIIVNTVVVPYFSVFVIPLMFILLMLSFLPSFLIKPIDLIFSLIHDRIIILIEKVDRVADFPFNFGEFPLVFILMYYAVFFLQMYQAERRKRQKAFLYGALLTLLIMTVAIRPYFSPVGTVTMLDIGQGDAIVIELPYRKGVFMIDAGSREIGRGSCR